MSVLVAEDCRTQRSIFCHMLNQFFDIEVIQVENGMEALEVLKQAKSVSCIISDMNMPHMGGLELLKQIKGMEPNLPFILMSTDTEKQDIIKGIHLGANSFILKPFDEKDVKSKLSPFLGDSSIEE